MEEQPITHRSVERLKQVNQRHRLSWRSQGVWLALALLLLALAACSPGASTAAGSNPQATSTHQPAPIHVPQGYHGIIVISFDASTTYEQAKAEVESAGLKLGVPCPNPGPIATDATPRPTDQRMTFPETHKLTAVGDPSVTTAMLNQVASAPGVTSVDVQPPVECPLIPVGG